MAEAREDVADMRRLTVGLTGPVWDVLSGAEYDQSDVRHLSRALGHLAGAVATTVDAYPEDRAGEGFLLRPDGRVDFVALKPELDEIDVLQAQLASASLLVQRVGGTRILLGPLLGRAVDSLENGLLPVRAGLQQIEPLAPTLPRSLGTDGNRNLPVALLNPAKQRDSDSAALRVEMALGIMERSTLGWPRKSVTVLFTQSLVVLVLGKSVMGISREQANSSSVQVLVLRSPRLFLGCVWSRADPQPTSQLGRLS